MSQFEVENESFSFKDPADFQRFRSLLDTIGYTDEGILEALRVKDVSSIRGSDLSLLLHRTNRGTPLDILIRLFLIEVPCDIETVQKAIQPMKIENWAHAGLVQAQKGSVTAGIKLLPYQNFILAFDLPKTLQSSKGKYYVMGIGSSSLTLANLTIRKHSGMTLDLGTGCGFQAFMASAHSDRILAVDRNPRAIQLAAFNAKINGMSNIELLEGNFFEPVKNHTFDLVVTNPPFVISPEMKYIYRDGGMPGDDVCKNIVHQVPKFLNDGGFCQILCNWVTHADQSWQQRLKDWFKGSGCDVWVMQTETRDAETYASTWIEHTERDDPEQFARRFEKWLAYYDQHDIEAVSAGLITMRKSNKSQNWYRTEASPEKMLGPCGDHIMRAFELLDFLETVRNNEDLLNTCMRVSPEIRLERQFQPSKDGWTELVTRLHLIRGLPYTGNIDPYVAKMVMECNGRRKLNEFLTDMAASIGRAPQEIESHFCTIVRGLIERGFLLPPGVGD